MSEVVNVTPEFHEDSLSEVQTFEDALALLADAGIEATEVTEYGDGFIVMDKAEFVNTRFIILDFKFADGDYKDDEGNPQRFAIMRIVTADGRKAVITDGSSGIRKQLEKVARKGRTGGIICPKGFVVSEYDYVNDKGHTEPAKTYYLHGM